MECLFFYCTFLSFIYILIGFHESYHWGLLMVDGLFVCYVWLSSVKWSTLWCFKLVYVRVRCNGGEIFSTWWGVFLCVMIGWGVQNEGIWGLSYWPRKINSRFTYMIKASEPKQARKDHLNLELIFSRTMWGVSKC